MNVKDGDLQRVMLLDILLIHEFTSAVFEGVHELHQRAYKRTVSAADRMSSYYNTKCNTKLLKLGDIVSVTSRKRTVAQQTTQGYLA